MDEIFVLPYEKFIKGFSKPIRPNAIGIKFKNGNIIICDDFSGKKKNGLVLYIYIKKENKWDKFHTIDKYTNYLWNYHEHLKNKSDHKLNGCNVSVEKLMRKKVYKTHSGMKSGGGTNQINQPLKWKEVTETAHWYGKGNASVVATAIASSMF